MEQVMDIEEVKRREAEEAAVLAEIQADIDRDLAIDLPTIDDFDGRWW